MASKEILVNPLPKEIAKTIEREGSSVPFEKLTKFLGVDAEGGIGNHIVFVNKISRKAVTPHSRRKLSRKERKKLGLDSLGKNQVKFEEISVVHELWEQYMRDLIKVKELIASNWNNSPEHARFEELSTKLYRADYHGALLTVVKSTCPSLVGCSGIVAMDLKNSYKLIGRDNICRTIPKNVCEFEFSLDQLKFQFHGQNLIVRAADRAHKKLKQIKPPTL